jgi:hypothetical protein
MMTKDGKDLQLALMKNLLVIDLDQLGLLIQQDLLLMMFFHLQ